MYFKDFRNLYRISNNGQTQATPTVKEIKVFSDQKCAKRIISTYVNDSGHTPNEYRDTDGSVAFDKGDYTYWSPQCGPCSKNEAWITFSTIENAGCISAHNLGQKSSQLWDGWNGGIKVEMKMFDGSWKSVIPPQKGNSATGGIKGR